MSSMEINEVITKNDLFTFLTTRKKYSNSYFIESYFKKIFKTHYENILNFHNKYYDFDIPFNQKLYNYLYDITKLPCCLNCGKNTKYVSFSYGYGTYCSTQCSLHSDVRAEVIGNSHRNKSKEDVEIAIRKREATCLEKYNVTYVSKCEAVKQKMKDTVSKKTDEDKKLTKEKVRNTWKNKSKEEKDEIVRKRNETNSNKSKEEKDEIHKKSVLTRIKHCGCIEESYRLGIEKGKVTNNEKYGVDNPFQLQKVIDATKEKWNKYRNENFTDVIEYIKETDTYICKCVDDTCNLCDTKKFSISTHNYLNRKRYGYSQEDMCVIKNPIGEYRGKSKTQDEIYDFVKSIYKDSIIYNDKNALKNANGKKIELDIFFPSINLAIEVNGDYWHANPKFYLENDVNKTLGLTAKEIWERDEQKRIICEQCGINLYVIWEYEWKHSRLETQERIKKILNVI